MKTLIRILKTTSLALATLFIFSCNNDDDDIPDRTTYDYISENPELSIFKAALDIVPELRDLLNDESGNQFTVFAPLNASFEDFLNANGYPGGISDIDMPDEIEFLTDYLSNHIAEDRISSITMTNENFGFLTTYTPDNINMLFDASGAQIVLNGAVTVTEADISANNGLVHIIDDVIEIPTLTTFVSAHPDFETMKEALIIIENDPGIASDINGELTTAVQYTLLMPTDNAFESLFEGITENDISELEPILVQNIVEIHVLRYNNIDSAKIGDELGNVLHTTDDLDIGVDGEGNYTLTDPQDRTATIIQTDVRAANGIIHIIDQVLLGN